MKFTTVRSNGLCFILIMTMVIPAHAHISSSTPSLVGGIVGSVGTALAYCCGADDNAKVLGSLGAWCAGALSYSVLSGATVSSTISSGRKQMRQHRYQCDMKHDSAWSMEQRRDELRALENSLQSVMINDSAMHKERRHIEDLLDDIAHYRVELSYAIIQRKVRDIVHSVDSLQEDAFISELSNISRVKSYVAHVYSDHQYPYLDAFNDLSSSARQVARLESDVRSLMKCDDCNASDVCILQDSLNTLQAYRNMIKDALYDLRGIELDNDRQRYQHSQLVKAEIESQRRKARAEEEKAQAAACQARAEQEKAAALRRQARAQEDQAETAASESRRKWLQSVGLLKPDTVHVEVHHEASVPEWESDDIEIDVEYEL